MSRPRVRPSAPRAPRLTRPERRQSIIDVATETLVADGADSVSMERIAALVGISKPVVYDHFPNREALLLAIYDEYSTHLAATVSATLERADDTMESIVRASIDGYFDAVEAKGYLIRVLTQAAPGEPGIAAARDRVRAGWVAFWSAKLRQFGDIPGAVAHDAITLVAHMAEQSAALWVGGHSDREAVADLYTRMAVAALSALIPEEPA